MKYLTIVMLFFQKALTNQGEKMNRIEFDNEKINLEKYFLDIVRNRFKNFFTANHSYSLSVDYETERDVNKILAIDGFTVYGMSVNKHEFILQLEFDYEYRVIDDFSFDRLDISINNDSGEYSLYLIADSFNDDIWDATLVDNYHRYIKKTKQEFEMALKGIKHTHLQRVLKLT